MKKMIWNRRLAAVVAAALSLSLLAGCGAPAAPAASASGEAAPVLSQEHAGTVLLSVNPEIEVRYDERGLVVEVEGVNEDGRGTLLTWQAQLPAAR